MSRARIAVSAALVLALGACGDAPVVVPDAPLVDEEAVTRNVVVSAADALGYLVDNLVDHEDWVSRGPPYAVRASTDRTWLVGRVNECYDFAGVRINQCLPFSSVRMFVTDGWMNGSRRSPTSPAGPSWAGVLHHVINDTTTRVFNAGIETGRIHNGVETSNDTTVFVEGDNQLMLAEAVIDSVKAVTFAVPATSARNPTSGSIVRRVTGRAEISGENGTATRDFSYRIHVTFPADVEGSVTLTIDGKSCQLKLSTRTVSSCQ
jgi:hypothetical protein